MQGERKTREQLMLELHELRQRFAESQKDNEERRLTEQALAGSEARYRALVENQTELITGFLLDGTVTFVNEASCRYFGLSRDELVGHTFWRLVPEEDHERIKEHIDSLDAEHPAGTIEHRVVAAGGEVRWQQWVNRAIFDARGRIVEYQGVGRDITDRRMAEEALRKSEERFRELAENIREVFWIRKPDEILYISPAYEKIWGRSCESLYRDPDSFLEPLHPEDSERVLQAYLADKEGKAPFDEEFRILRADGGLRWVRARSFPVRERGSLVRTVGIAEDITGRRNAEEFLRIERDLALGLASVDSLPQALEHLLDACLRVNGLDSGGIYLVESETGALMLVCHRGLSAGFIERVSFYEANSPQGRFVMKGEPGYWSDPAGIFEMGGLLVDEGLRALASIPARFNGDVVAVLNLSSHTLSEIPALTRSALETLASEIAGVISRVRLSEMLKMQSERLSDANAALRVLLEQRERDRTELEESLLQNVKHLITPSLEQLKRSRLTGDQRNLVAILESNLGEITSPFVRTLSASMLGLTPTEIRVAELIRRGKGSKEIAGLLGASERAVVFHRQGIRGKLGLRGKKINLQTYLATLAYK